jgi:hypothetical protein
VTLTVVVIVGTKNIRGIHILVDGTVNPVTIVQQVVALEYFQSDLVIKDYKGNSKNNRTEVHQRKIFSCFYTVSSEAKDLS